MNNSGNFSVYRKQESSATGPVIPYLALHLRDLIYIAENKLFNEEGELNFAGNERKKNWGKPKKKMN
jgi:hypothetical protein